VNSVATIITGAGMTVLLCGEIQSHGGEDFGLADFKTECPRVSEQIPFHFRRLCM
jgi:hypothetical protein